MVTGGSSLRRKLTSEFVAKFGINQFEPEISCFGNFSPVEKGKEQGKQLKHEQAIVPKQNRNTWAVFEYCTGFFILLYWLLMKGQAKRASAKGFPFPKSLKKSCLPLGP